MTDARTIVFFPEGAYGPTNNCVGIGQVLRARGHRVVFIVEESFAGTLEMKGFEERLMRLGPPPAEPEVPGQFWIDFIRDTAPVFRKSTLEQLGEFIAPTWQALIDGSKYVNPRLAEIFDELAPDVIVEDNVVAFPAITASGRPWVRIVSCNPMELKDPLIAPFSSGYPVDDRSGWPAFLDEVRRTHADMWWDFDAFCRENGETGLAYGDLGPEFIAESPYLNLYSYPAEADYERAQPLGPTWHRLDSTVRASEATWELPPELAEREGALIYLSLGSLGSADVELMQRLVDVLATTKHRVIVSKGPLADQISAARQPDGRGVPAAAGDPADGRPRHHARRQQHGHRGLPSRQADDRPAALLGPGRQRATGPRDRLRPQALDVRFQGQGADERDRPVAEGSTVVRASRGHVVAHQVDVRNGPSRRSHRAGRPRWLAGSGLTASRDGSPT